MIEDLVVLFLVVLLLFATVVSTRESMTAPELTKEQSLRAITEAMEKKGPQGTISLFDTQLKKYEDLIAHENDKDE